ncbi:MAG: dpaA [Lachnospiraceae bacterium]|jgi:dipicolinate synthase subunit A|nr:dpaA [Lachnospiraceae bacterium]
MNRTNYDFAFVGGDMRQVYMVNDLIQRKYSVIVYSLADSILDTTCGKANTLAEAINLGLTIIAPIPVTKDGVYINSRQPDSNLSIDELCQLLTPSNRLYGGCLTERMKEHCDKNGIFYDDLMENEEITLFNTIATAEGTIAEAIINSTTNLHGSNCLIIGYGKCAKTLAYKLKPLCGSVDITARSSLALSQASTASFGKVDLSQLDQVIGNYDYIFNTVPAMILPKAILIHTKEDVTIIDIATNPGGVDFSFAKEINRNAKLCLGLPGKYAPESSAVFLNNYILSNFRK